MRFLLQWISFRHMAREKRSWLTFAGVALGIAVFVSIRIANKSILAAYHDSVSTVAGNTTLEVVGRAGDIDESDLISLRRAPGVRYITPIVQSALPMNSPPSARGEILLLIGIDLLQEGPFRAYETAGTGNRQTFEALLDPSAVLLTETFATRHRLHIGDRFSVRKGEAMIDLQVAGLLKGEGIAQAQDGNIAIMDIASAQWRLGKLGRLDRIDLITDPRISLDRILSELTQQLGSRYTVRRPRQRTEQVVKMLSAFQLNLTALSAISLFVGIFLIYNTILVSVVHRKKETGILRALGVPRSRIFWIFTLEGIVIGTAGGVVGVLAGAGLARWVLKMLSRTVSALYVSIPPSPFSLPPSVFSEGIAIGALVATLSSFLPALQAGLIKPREAMEGIYTSQRPLNHRRFLACAALFGAMSFLLSQVPSGWHLPLAGYLSAAMLLIAFSLLVPSTILLFSRMIGPLVVHASPPWRLAQGHLEQAIRRNGPTIAAFMGALAMMISVVIMIESFRDTVVLWIDQTVQADIIGFPVSFISKESGETLPEELVARIRAVPEVEAVDGYRSLEILFRDEPALLVGRNLAVHAARSRYLFQSGNSGDLIQKAIREKNVLISEVFANRFHLRQGEIIELPTSAGNAPFQIAGVFYDYSTDGGKIVVDRSLLESLWNEREVEVASIYLKKGTSADRARQHLVQQFGEQYGLTFVTQSAFKKEILTIFDQTFLITYALEWIAIVVALLGITNTLFVSILERRREIGILRAIGGSQNQVVQVVLTEAFYMGLIGNFLSIFCAFFLSLLLIFVINKESFGWTILFRFPPSVLLHSLLLAVGTALAAGYFPARTAAKMDVTEAIAYE